MDALRLLQTDEDPALIRRWMLPGAVYPVWHLLAPAGARDPWMAWWLIGAAFVGVSLGSLWSTRVRQRLRLLHLGVCWAVTLQLFVLAHLNDLHLFYAMGSILATVSTALVLPSKAAFLAYGAFVMALALTSYAIEPDSFKLACWMPLPTVFAVLYYRQQLHLRAVGQVRADRTVLERRVEERTRELSEANEALRGEIAERSAVESQLRHSQKMEAVGRLAGGIAHDFNNLLTAIGGYAELLHAELPSDEALRGDVEQLLRAVDRAAALTRQLLVFARPQTVQLANVEPNAVLAEMREMLDTVLGSHVELEIVTDPEAGCIRADPAQLEQVILNLVLNARDAMPDGGSVRLETRFVKHADLPAEIAEGRISGDSVQLCVVDTGSGMDERTRSRVFEPFFTTKEVGRGTGLGLAAVYGILQQAGGTVRVISEPHAGSRFELYWPRVQGHATAHRSERRSVLAGAARAGERILLVEDDDSVRRIARRALESGGYAVRESADAPHALRMLEEDAGLADLVVTDAVMPRMSGFELAERLSALRPETRILLVSGQLDHPSVRECVLSANVAFLRKPFTPGELCNRVREMLDRPAPGAGAS